ncbi:MAG: ABC transporter substrate-binding protein, partial [Pseudobdellovibrionaceae bacterium]
MRRTNNLIRGSLKRLSLTCLVFIIISAISSGITLGQQPKLQYYKVGVIAPISGPAAVLGKYFTQAVEIETKYLNESGGINGIPLKLFVEDDQTNPSLTVVATKKLIQEDVVCICGPVLTNMVLAAIPEIEKASIPSICAGAGREVIDPFRKWVFKIPHTDTKVVHLMLKFAKESLKVNKVAVLFQDDASGVSGAKQTRELASKYGISVVAEESCHASDTNMVPQLTKISKTDAEAVLIFVVVGPGAIVAKNSYQIGFKKPLIYYHGAVSESLIKVAGNAAEGTYFAGVKPTV